MPNNYKINFNSSSENNKQMTSTSKFLIPGQCLVYVENRQPFADVDGSTQIARIVRSFVNDDKLWFDLMLETSADGDKLVDPNPVTVSEDRIISNRNMHDIEPKTFYHFASSYTYGSGSTTFSNGIEYPIKAGSFVIKKKLSNPLESTSCSALGSGIYGRYIANPDDIQKFLIEQNQSVYLIDCPNAYVLQDKEHGESLTLASLNTNRYMDRIIQSLRVDDVINFEIVQTRIHINESPNLLTLWNIAFSRTGDIIDQDWLETILARYAVNYLQNNHLVDSINEEVINELPINDIMKGLGYEGVIASDHYNNGWDRGCVSYNYDQAVIIQGENARY